MQSSYNKDNATTAALKVNETATEMLERFNRQLDGLLLNQLGGFNGLLKGLLAHPKVREDKDLYRFTYAIADVYARNTEELYETLCEQTDEIRRWKRRKLKAPSAKL